MDKHVLEENISLVSVSCGKTFADMYLLNGRIVNVFTCEILTGKGIAVKRGRIAYVGPETTMIGPKTEVIDCEGDYLIPGYVDAHCHSDFLLNPGAFAEHVIKYGTTTLLTELTETGALGEKGIDFVLNATEHFPMNYFVSLPSTIPAVPEIEGQDYFPVSVIKKYVKNKRIIALGEITPWPRITSIDEVLLEKICVARDNGLFIEGHLTGCKNFEINALVAAGIGSCHESVTAEEAKEKLGFGLYVMLRHGSVRRDLKELSRLITDNQNIDTSRIILTPDWLTPEDMAEYGYINYIVKSACEFGIDPVTAIRMVTINPAVYLRLDREVGSLSPGRKADILKVRDIRDGNPDLVIQNGKVVARSGKLCLKLEVPEELYEELQPVLWPKKRFNTGDFSLSVSLAKGCRINFPVIQVINKTITKRLDIELTIENGHIKTDQAEGLLKLSVLHPDGGLSTGLVKGFGDGIGGLATSIGVLNNKVVIIGMDDNDMMLAANRMLEINGGIVLVKNGKILSEVPLSVACIQSPETVDVLGEQLKKIKDAIHELGCSLEDPLYTIHFLTMTGLPYVRMVPQGVFDVVKKKIIFPFR